MRNMCGECQFFDATKGVVTGEGACRRHAPRGTLDMFNALAIAIVHKFADIDSDAASMVVANSGEWVAWPKVYLDDWCGDYKRARNVDQT